MLGIQPLLSILVMALFLNTPVHGDSRNAARWYQQMAESLSRLSVSDWEAIEAYRGDLSGPPSPQVREILARAGPAMNFARRGSRQAHSDYDLDYSQGFELILPHLSPLRRMTLVMQVDAVVKMQDGDSAGAADRIASMYRMSEHIGSDRIIISSLVGRAMFNAGDEAAQFGLDRQMFDETASQEMFEAIDAFDDFDPFEMVEAVAGEQEITASWMLARFGDQDERRQIIEEYGWLTNDEADGQVFAEMSDEAFASDIERYDVAMTQVVEAFAMEDRAAARVELERISNEVKASEHGLLASMIMPSFLRVFDNMEDSREAVAKRTAQLEGLVTGEIKAADEANAALFYARGIEIMRGLEPPQLAAILGYSAQESGRPDEAVADALIQTQPIVDLFREGSHKRRCDYAYLRPGTRPPLCPEYVPGMHEALMLLRADALRLLEDGDPEAAAERLGITFRVVAHLTGDEPVLSALVAHHAFGRALTLAGANGQSEVWSAPQRHVMLDAVERISRKDPFGYLGSIKAMRDQLSNEFRGRFPLDEAHRARLKKMARTVETWNGDQLLFMTAVIRAIATSGSDLAEIDRRESGDAVERLGDLISLSALKDARNEALLLAPMLEREDSGILDGREIPDIASVVKRSRRARADLRQGLNALRPRAAAEASR